VLFGINLELWEELSAWFFERESKRSRSREWEQHQKRFIWWVRWYTSVGVILVLIGVAGELYIEGELTSPQNRLRDFNKGLEASIQKEAAEGNERAEVAFEQAARFQAQIASANARAKEAESMVSSANAAAAEAQSMARSADLARAQLEERIAPRTLTVGQREYIGRKLNGYALRFLGRSVKLDWPLSEAEPTIFGIELEDSIKKSFIEVERPINVVLGGPLRIGMSITGPAKDAAFIRTLYFLLHADFPREVLSYEALAKHDLEPVTVFIGVKTPEGLDTLPVQQTSTQQ